MRDLERTPWYEDPRYVEVIRQRDELERHGWYLVGEPEDYPVTMSRRRFRLFGAELLIMVSLETEGVPHAGIPADVLVEGVGWIVRCDHDLLGWFTW